MSLGNFFTVYETAYATGYSPGASNISTQAHSFEVDLVAYLTSANLGVSIYPGHVPQPANLPAVCYQAIAESPWYTIKRASGLTIRTYQLSIFSTLYSDCCSIEVLLRNVLHGYQGPMGSTAFTSVWLDQVRDLPYTPSAIDSDSGTFQRAIDYKIAFREPVPILY